MYATNFWAPPLPVFDGHHAADAMLVFLIVCFYVFHA